MHGHPGMALPLRTHISFYSTVQTYQKLQNLPSDPTLTALGIPYRYSTCHLFFDNLLKLCNTLKKL